MRSVLALAAVVLASAVSLPATAGECRQGCARFDEAAMPINQFQVVGTAQSAKQAPSPALLRLIGLGGRKGVEALNFSEPPLPAQLDAGARILSFDVAYDPAGGLYAKPAGASMSDEVLSPDYIAAMSKPGFKVIPVADIDYRSSCITLKACLAQIAGWSRAHQGHHPIVIRLHVNDARTPMPGATRPLPVTPQSFAALESEIRAVFHPGDMITPDQLRGSHASLREAATSGGWPVLAAASGKVIFVLDDTPQKVALYAGSSQTLAGKAMFVTAPESSPLASFVTIENPLKEGARIAAAVRAGFMVITKADDDTREARSNDMHRRDAAFASGAQWIETDFLVPDKTIGPYQVTIADSRHMRCDSVLAADTCIAWSHAGPKLAAAR